MMETPDLNETLTTPCLANPNLAEIKTKFKIKISKEMLMMLHNNAYNGDEANDAVDHITRFLQIINLVKIPIVDQKQLCILAFPHSLTGKAQSSNDECDESNLINHYDINSSFDPYLRANDEGNKGHHMKCNDNTCGSENFVQNDAPHSDNINQQNNGICRVDKFEVIKYSIGDNKEFMGIRTLERDS
ncbi:hypothetical protein Tco_1353502 [Tanacetum coccineum]